MISIICVDPTPTRKLSQSHVAKCVLILRMSDQLYDLHDDCTYRPYIFSYNQSITYALAVNANILASTLDSL